MIANAGFLYLCAMKLSKKSKKNIKPAAVEQPPKRKPVKKDTSYRKFRAWVLRLEHRQKNDTPPIVVHDTATTHVCMHCGTEYTGSYCPKCSMPSRWRRFDWKLLFLNFMDIWGLGNRPMFRTIRDLIWRPGYMIRDYLRGHHLSYFPPFKMLAVWTILLVFMMWVIRHTVTVTPEDAHSFAQGITDSMGGKLSETTSFLVDQIDRVLEFLDDHMLYKIIVQNILVVLAVKAAFRKISDFNLVETFFSQIYINCQFHILAFVSMLLTWSVLDHYSMFPYMVGLIPAPLVLTYDFHQLYGVTWKRALWKTIVTTIYLVLLYLIVVAILVLVLMITEGFTNPTSGLFQGNVG